MPITYGGIPLLLEDPGQELQDWLEKYQAVEDLRVASERSPASMSRRSGSRAGTKAGVGLPVPNFPAPPPPRLNSLWWPTGASRWARGYFLADEATKEAIVAKAHPDGSTSSVPLDLVMSDGVAETTITATMALLQPRPISGISLTDNPDANRLWLIPLVDGRYFWQFDAINLNIASIFNWQAVFSALGLDSAGSASAYLVPDLVEFNREYDNRALLADAAAASIGGRVVVQLNGARSVHSPAIAATGYNLNFSNQSWKRIAGNNFSVERGHVPASVVVTFPKYRDKMAFCDGPLYPLAYNAPASLARAKVAGAEKEVHSSCYADYTTRSANPDNLTELTALGQQIADDFYAWLEYAYDTTFVGLKPWVMNGFDDAVEYSFGRQLSDGSYAATTRVRSMPPNFGVEQNVSADPDLFVLEHVEVGVINDDLVPYPSGTGYTTASVWNGTLDEDGEDTDIDVRVYGWPRTKRFTAGQKVHLLWHCDENVWYAIEAKGGNVVVRFVLTEDRDYAESINTTKTDAEILEWDADLSIYSPTGQEIAIVDPVGRWAGKTGYRGWGVKMDDRDTEDGEEEGDPTDVYEIIYLEAPARWLDFVLKMDATPVADDDNAVYKAEVEWEDEDVLFKFHGAAPNHHSPPLIPPESEGSDQLFVWDNLGLLSQAKADYRGRAVYDEKLDRYYVQHIETKASLIHFTLTGEFSSNVATATVDAFYALNGWDVIDPGGAGIDVEDPQQKFKRALEDAKGIARYDHKEGKYYVLACEQKAGFIEFTLDADMATGTAAATIVQYWGTNGWDVQDPDPTVAGITVYDEAGLFPNALEDAKGIAVYDWIDDKYRIVAMRNCVVYGIAQSNWADNSGDPLVSVKIIDARVGGTPSGTAFDVYLPRVAEKDPNVRTGDVIGFMLDTNDDPVCVTDYLDDKFGTIKLWSDVDSNIPPGWYLCDGDNGTKDLRGRFIVGQDGSNAGGSHSDTYTLNTTGGKRKHSHKYTPCAKTNIDDTGGTTINHWLNVPDEVGGPSGGSTTADANTTDGDMNMDHRPPWYVLSYIQRID